MPGASPLYPTVVPDMTELRTVIDDVDDVIATDHNDLAQEIIALAKELGVLPKGSCADLKTRLGISLSDDGHIFPSEYITGVPTFATSLGIPGEKAVSAETAYFCIDTDIWKCNSIAAW